MHIQVNTDKNINGDQALIAEVTDIIESALGRLSDHITRVEVHLSDENSSKKSGDDDIRCLVECRLEGRNPVAVSHQAGSVAAATTGAADKMTQMVDSTLNRLRQQQRESPTHLPPEPIEDLLADDASER